MTVITTIDFAHKARTPNHSYAPRKQKGLTGQNQSSSDTDQQRTARWLFLDFKNTMLNVA